MLFQVVHVWQSRIDYRCPCSVAQTKAEWTVFGAETALIINFFAASYSNPDLIPGCSRYSFLSRYLQKFFAQIDTGSGSQSCRLIWFSYWIWKWIEYMNAYFDIFRSSNNNSCLTCKQLIIIILSWCSFSKIINLYSCSNNVWEWHTACQTCHLPSEITIAEMRINSAQWNPACIKDKWYDLVPSSLMLNLFS